MAKILDGKKLADKILENLKKKIKKTNLKLGLAVILVGENPTSEIFINQKRKACERIKIDFHLYKFPKKIRQKKLKKEIEKIVVNPKNSGVIIQLPLPKRIKANEILNLIPLKKDIDLLSEASLGKFCQGTSSILPPPVAGILCLLRNYKISLKGKNVVIVGAGRLIGLPLAIQLLKEKATLSVLNKWTQDAPSFIKKADILISGVGKPNLIEGNMVKKGAVLIDAGTSYKKGKFFGDVDFKSCFKKASYLTPVPGGVGPLTVACLIENLVKLNN